MLFCRAASVHLLALALARVGAGAWLLGAANTARAESSAPAHVIATSSIGAPLRLAPQDELGQRALAPAYADALGGYVFAGGRYRHGIGLGLSLNLEGDGGYAEPVRAGQQVVSMPAYLAYYELDADWLLLGHLGVPFALTVSPSVGVEAAFGVGYRVLAGFGAYAELGAGGFLGTASNVNPMLSLEVGLVLDYEVLP